MADRTTPVTMTLAARNLACSSLNNPQELINIHKGYWANQNNNRGAGGILSPSERASVTNNSARGMYSALGCGSTLCQISGDGDTVTCALPRGIDPSWNTTRDCGENCHLELNRLSKIFKPKNVLIRNKQHYEKVKKNLKNSY